MTVEELGHKNVGIDVFKCDCEGCEYRVGSAFWDPEIGIKQMQLEVHFGGKWRSEGSAQADFMEQLIRKRIGFSMENPKLIIQELA